MIKTTLQTIVQSLHDFGNLYMITVRYVPLPVRYRYDVNDQCHDHVPDHDDRFSWHELMGK